MRGKVAGLEGEWLAQHWRLVIFIESRLSRPQPGFCATMGERHESGYAKPGEDEYAMCRTLAGGMGRRWRLHDETWPVSQRYVQ